MHGDKIYTLNMLQYSKYTSVIVSYTLIRRAGFHKLCTFEDKILHLKTLVNGKKNVMFFLRLFL
jgi:hypothetical protein